MSEFRSPEPGTVTGDEEDGGLIDGTGGGDKKFGTNIQYFNILIVLGLQLGTTKKKVRTGAI